MQYFCFPSGLPAGLPTQGLPHIRVPQMLQNICRIGAITLQQGAPRWRGGGGGSIDPSQKGKPSLYRGDNCQAGPELCPEDHR